MRYAGHVLGIAETANVDVHGGTGFVCGRIVYQQNLELVRQCDYAIRAVVDFGTLQVLDARSRGASSQ